MPLKSRAKKQMKALRSVFLAIRSNPGDPVHRQVIAIFRDHLSQIPDQRNDWNALIRQLAALDGDSYVQQLVRTLNKPAFLSRSVSMGRIDAIPIMIDILDQLSAKIDHGDWDQARTMASAVHNYPDFIIREFKAADFWEEHICYYARTFGEPFLEQWKSLFTDDSHQPR